MGGKTEHIDTYVLRGWGTEGGVALESSLNTVSGVFLREKGSKITMKSEDNGGSVGGSRERGAMK